MGSMLQNFLSGNSLTMKTQVVVRCCLLSLSLRGFDLRSAEVIESDICVYGGTSAGVAGGAVGSRGGDASGFCGVCGDLAGLWFWVGWAIGDGRDHEHRG